MLVEKKMEKKGSEGKWTGVRKAELYGHP